MEDEKRADFKHIEEVQIFFLLTKKKINSFINNLPEKYTENLELRGSNESSLLISSQVAARFEKV